MLFDVHVINTDAVIGNKNMVALLSVTEHEKKRKFQEAAELMSNIHFLCVVSGQSAWKRSFKFNETIG